MSTAAANLFETESQSASQHCFHCGLPVPTGIKLQTNIDGASRAMCCRGCLAIAEAIVEGGHEHYYRSRTEMPNSAAEIIPDFLPQSAVYDNPVLLNQYASTIDDNHREISLAIDGITCSACIWLIERHLSRQPGVESIAINYVTHRAQLVWNDNKTSLSDIIDAVRDVGYSASPYKPEQQQQRLAGDYKQSLRRLVVAGIFGMQIMTLAVALYSAGAEMDPRYQTLFRWISLVLCAPILIFSARPFFSAAVGQVFTRQLGMDVPVSLGIGIAFCASVISTVSGSGEIYFDSVAMFTFLLLLARHAELLTRVRANNANVRWSQSTPEIATRLETDGTSKQVAAIELYAGDRVRVLPGQVIPVDGKLIAGSADVDESLLTGEAFPVAKIVGDPVIGGTVVLDQVMHIEVTATTTNSFSAQLSRLLERAQSEKPALVRLADKVASYFVSVVLIIAASVSVFWWSAGESQWLAITVATLIVTCPCALSLATPAAITAASNAMANAGLLVARGHAIETLPHVTEVVFDKTGTLTDGKLLLTDVHVLNGQSRREVLEIAAALEQHSQHPVAKALQWEIKTNHFLATLDVHTATGGVSGTINRQRWHFGSNAYLKSEAGAVSNSLEDECECARSVSILACENEPVAVFYFSHRLREGAASLISELQKAGKKIAILSGDNDTAVQNIARDTGVDAFYSNLSPEEKLEYVKKRQSSGEVVAMVGDGGNDSPVLAAADVSIAMGAGTDIAKNNADIILLKNSLPAIFFGLVHASKTKNIIRQNIVWAIGYNAISLPFAASGIVTPWMAAIGMSLSSLIVVLNARAAKSLIMDILFLLIPIAVLLAVIIVVAFFWAVRSGQFDDLEGPAKRIFHDED